MAKVIYSLLSGFNLTENIQLQVCLVHAEISNMLAWSPMYRHYNLKQNLYVVI